MLLVNFLFALNPDSRLDFQTIIFYNQIKFYLNLFPLRANEFTVLYVSKRKKNQQLAILLLHLVASTIFMVQFINLGKKRNIRQKTRRCIKLYDAIISLVMKIHAVNNCNFQLLSKKLRYQASCVLTYNAEHKTYVLLCFY